MQNLIKRGSRLHQTCVRFGQRIPLELPVTLSADGLKSAPGVIRNASISGGFIETTLELPLHANLVVTLDVQKPEPAATHALNACVVRIDAFGLGIEWRDMACVDVLELLQRAPPSA
jgi:hypothetical protein